MKAQEKIQQLETRVFSIFEELVALRKELSGGSESSKLTTKQKKRLVANRRNKLIG